MTPTPRFYARLQHGETMEAKFTTPLLASKAAFALQPLLGYLPSVEVYVNGSWVVYDLVGA